MVRVDASQLSAEMPSLDLAYPRGFSDDFLLGEVVGRGGFGEVCKAFKRSNGQAFACKVLRKRLSAPNVSQVHQERHLRTIEREVAVLRALRSTLNVVHLDSVYEDEDNVYIVMELCTGGELWHRIGLRPYSEETVARIMRAALRTLAQCHSLKILHRDVKPGNFMCLSEDADSPIKAVDFGLAVMFDPETLPRSDLGFDGTPWYMAPEVLSSAVVPASDVWAAGVMAHQLLTGYLPFDDRKNRKEPALSVVWKSILHDDVDFDRSYWSGISSDAKDFVKMLLTKDPSKRPSAKDALRHTWVKKGGSNFGAPTISYSIVQRIQRYGQSTIFRRSVLEMIAKELLQLEMETSSHGREMFGIPFSHSPTRDIPSKSWHNGSLNKQGISVPGANSVLGYSPDLTSFLSSSSSRPSVLNSYWGGKQRCHSHQDLTQLAEYKYEEWQEKRKAVRVSLDTSVHGLGKYSNIHKEDLISSSAVASNNDDEFPNIISADLKPRKRLFSEEAQFPGTLEKVIEDFTDRDATKSEEGTIDYEVGRRGQNLFQNYLESREDQFSKEIGIGSKTEPQTSSNAPAKSLLSTLRTQLNPLPIKKADRGMSNQKKRPWLKTPSANSNLLRILSEGGDSTDTQKILDAMNLTVSGTSSELELMQSLKSLGYNINESELDLLLDCMAPAHDGRIHMSQFVASQVDWQHLQKNHREQWLKCVHHAFKSMDKDGDGKISSVDLVQAIGEKLPAEEVELSFEQAKLEACAEDMDFDGFVRMVRVDSRDSLASLDQFDSRSAMPQYSISLKRVDEN